MNPHPLVIFHAGCRDGFAAAWAVRRGLGGGPAPDWHPGYYGQPAPNCSGRDVIIVDFSYKRPDMERIARTCNTLLVLDHHATAERDLDGLATLDGATNLHVEFDMARSGAGMAWDHYFPGRDRPWFINYVEDRDLWRKVLPNTEEVNAYISILPFEFEEWDAQEDMGFRDSIIDSGYTVIRKTQQYIREVLKNARVTIFEGHATLLVNCPQVDISETLDVLCTHQVPDSGNPPLPVPTKFAMGWWQRADGRFQYSLRSRGDFDVSALAKKHGGGGHKNAAGFEADSPVHLWW